MSTKTTFKRIALVAVAALGLGVLSVAPSSATTRLDNVILTGVTTSVTAGETASARVNLTYVTNSTTADTMTVTASVASRPSTASTSPNSIFAVVDSTTGTIQTLSVEQAAPTATIRPNGAVGPQVMNYTLNILTTAATTAGDYRYVVYTTSGTGGEVAVPQYITITVAALNRTATGASTSTLAPGVVTTNTENIDSSVVASRSITTASGAAADQAANILVRQKNATSTAGESFTAVVSGPAWVTSSAAVNGASRPTSGTAITVRAGDYVQVWSNGTAGKATITLTTISGLLLGTETVSFFGPVTKIAQVQAIPLSIGRAGGFSTTGAFDIAATDALGTAVTGLTVQGISSDSNVISSVTVTADATSPGDYLVDYTTSASAKSGDKATITFRVQDPAVTTSVAYLTTTANVTIGGSVNKITVTTDKTSYAPGEQMIVTVTAVDASGNPVADGRPVPTLSSNKTVTGLSTSFPATFTGGKADSIARSAVTGLATTTYRVFAPASSGEFSIYADYTDAASASQRVTATATVADASIDAATDAANEATDAANAATDAALAAADAADAATAAAQDASDAVAALSASVSKLISSLRAQITSLTNLVIKIQKKVRA
jgi:trimeric autotransporter adhesin